MTIRSLNSIGGFSVGSNPQTEIILANGDIVTTNITANGIIDVTLSPNVSLGDVANIHITGGNTGSFLQTDGNGNLSFATIAGLDSAAPMPYYVPVGQELIVPLNYQGLFSQTITIDGTFEVDGVLIQVTDTVNANNNQVLYSENGTPTGNTGFTFQSYSGNLYVPGNVITTGDLLPDANITYSLGSSTKRWNNLYLAGNTIYLGTGTISTDVNGDIALVSANGGQLLVTGNASVTSIENGNSNISITANGNVVTSVSGNLAIFTVTDTGANVYGTLDVTGNISTNGILTDNYYYANGAPLDFSQPGGSNTQIQFNNNNNFGASANLTFDSATNILTVAGNVSATNVSANTLISTDGCVTVGVGAVVVAGANAGIFNASISNINIGLAANVTLGSTSGVVTARNNLDVGNTLDAPNITVGDLYSRRTSIPVTTNTVIDTFPKSYFRSAKYTIRVGDDTGYQAIEVLLVHNNINSIITVYGSLSTTGIDLVTLTTAINGANIDLMATGLGSNTTVNLLGTYVPD